MAAQKIQAKYNGCNWQPFPIATIKWDLDKVLKRVIRHELLADNSDADADINADTRVC